MFQLSTGMTLPIFLPCFASLSQYFIVLTYHNDIVSSIDQGYMVALMLLDLSSPFDTVDHPTLLSLLRDRSAVSDRALAWFHSYLTNRTKTFTTASSHTAPLSLPCGVPQGSGIGPTSFLTYFHTRHFLHSFTPISLVCR